MKLRHLMPLAILAGASSAFAGVPPSAPVGVTLIEVVRELVNSQPQVLWERPGDAQGHTLFSYAKDDAKNARCIGECAVEFPPLLALKGAKPTGDWTLLRRAEGMQWVYQGHPLYSWTKEEVLEAIKNGTVHGFSVSSGFFGSGQIFNAQRFKDEELGKRVAKATLEGFGIAA